MTDNEKARAYEELAEVARELITARAEHMAASRAYIEDGETSAQLLELTFVAYRRRCEATVAFDRLEHRCRQNG